MIGYQTMKQDFFIHYAKPEYSQNKSEYFPKLIQLDEAQAYMKEKNKDVNKQFREVVPKVLEAHFTIKNHSAYNEFGLGMRLTVQCVMAVESILSDDEIKILEGLGTSLLKKIAKEFNRQVFTETEYGYAKMPESMKYPFGFYAFDCPKPEDIINGKA